MELIKLTSLPTPSEEEDFNESYKEEGEEEVYELDFSFFLFSQGSYYKLTPEEDTASIGLGEVVPFLYSKISLTEYNLYSAAATQLSETMGIPSVASYHLPSAKLDDMGYYLLKAD